MADSKTKALAEAIVGLIAAWTPSPHATWPSFTPRYRWVPTEELDQIGDLVVNVAPGSLASKPEARNVLGRTTKVAVQIAKRVDAEDEADQLLDLCERLESFLFTQARQLVSNKFALQKTEIQNFDWKLFEKKRVFHTVLIATYQSQELT